MEKKVSYKASGFVWGYNWGGGEGGYESETIYADTEDELLATANKMLEDGSLDAGMGFESLIGAVLEITKTTEIEVEGEPYSRTEYSFTNIGELNDDVIDLLFDTIERGC